VPALLRRRCGRRSPGSSSSGLWLRVCWRWTSSPWRRSCCGGCTSCCDRGRDPPGRRARGHSASSREWVTQQARDLLMALEDRVGQFRVPVGDRIRSSPSRSTRSLLLRGSRCCVRRCGHRGRTPTLSGGWAPCGASCWTGCSSSHVGIWCRCWPRTPITTTCTAHTAPWGRPHRSGPSTHLSSCRPEGLCDGIDSVD
jgi:hypothetical protein